MYFINFTVTKKQFCLRLHYNGANGYLFVDGTENYKFKAKDSETLDEMKIWKEHIIWKEQALMDMMLMISKTFTNI